MSVKVCADSGNSICIAKNYETVLGLRLGLGLGEAFFQAAPVYLTLWYKRNEFGLRGAIFFTASPASGAFNGLIAYGLEKNLDGAEGITAWRW
jgi:MFS family permease